MVISCFIVFLGGVILKKRFLSIFLASKRQDPRFRTQEGEDVDTPTEQLAVDSLLTPSE